MTDVFAAQWLQLERLANHQPDPVVFPGITAALKQSMEQETKLFFQDVLQRGGSMRSLLAADYTFLNPALAQHYGMTAPAGTAFAKVSVAGTNSHRWRVGARQRLDAFLRLEDDVRREARGVGSRRLFCAAAPPPPPAVAKELMDNAAAIASAAATQTARQFLAQHRARVQCAVCHNQIDPPWAGPGELRPGRSIPNHGQGNGHRPSGRSATA